MKSSASELTGLASYLSQFSDLKHVVKFLLGQGRRRPTEMITDIL